MTAVMAAASALEVLYEALGPADREAVDVRRGLGETLTGALTGAGLLLPAAADETAARARLAVAEELGLRLAVVDVDGAELAAVDPPSREACAAVAAAAGEWARLHGGHLVPDDWRTLLAATDTDHSRISTARRRARAALTGGRAVKGGRHG